MFLLLCSKKFQVKNLNYIAARCTMSQYINKYRKTSYLRYKCIYHCTTSTNSVWTEYHSYYYIWGWPGCTGSAAGFILLLLWCQRLWCLYENLSGDWVHLCYSLQVYCHLSRVSPIKKWQLYQKMLVIKSLHPSAFKSMVVTNIQSLVELGQQYFGGLYQNWALLYAHHTAKNFVTSIILREVLGNTSSW